MYNLIISKKDGHNVGHIETSFNYNCIIDNIYTYTRN